MIVTDSASLKQDIVTMDFEEFGMTYMMPTCEEMWSDEQDGFPMPKGCYLQRPNLGKFARKCPSLEKMFG